MKKIPFLIDKKIVYINHKITSNKNMYLKITRENELLITSPPHISDQEIIKCFSNKIKKFLQLAINLKSKILYSFSGKFIYYEGKKYGLKILTGFLKEGVKTCGNKFYVHSKDGQELMCDQILKKYLKQKMFEYARVNQKQFEHLMQVPPHKIKVNYKFSSWATNNIQQKTIIYSSRLMHFKKEIRNCVIIHELAHYFFKNHSSQFYDLVTKFCPNYRNLQVKL